MDPASDVLGEVLDLSHSRAYITLSKSVSGSVRKRIPLAWAVPKQGLSQMIELKVKRVELLDCN
jgi:hypothetical protein